jgi:hypothetical protein
MSEPVETQAWHFTNGKTLRDGRPIPPVGEWLVHDGPLVPCESGLHASERLLDALAFAPGGTLHRVTLRGNLTPHGNPADKLVARERRIDWALDEITTQRVLREFARWCALQVLHLWDAPGVVVQYLETGDESLRDAAWHAAWYAAGDAAWAAAGATADAADAAGDAAWDVAWYAAWYAARAAARAATWDAWAAARATAGDAAGDAAWYAARDAQNTELTRLVMAARNAPEEA